MNISTDAGWRAWSDFVLYYPASIHRRKFILKQINKIQHWKSIADFGCGNALLINLIYQKFNTGHREFFGLDVSHEQIDRNKELFPNLNFDQLNIGSQSSTMKFDIITCSEVIEHILDYKTGIANISNSLNEGGHVIITVPTGEIFYTEQTFGHFRHFLADELIEEFKNNGVECIKCYSWGFPFHDLTKIIANINPSLSLKKFASGELSFFSKAIFKIVNYIYYLNILPMGKQLYYIGRKI